MLTVFLRIFSVAKMYAHTPCNSNHRSDSEFKQDFTILKLPFIHFLSIGFFKGIIKRI